MPLETPSPRAAGPAKPYATSRKSAERRQAITRAAIEIINVKSYELATMTEIAASLGLRDATLYYYYPSKQALVYACHLGSLARLENLLVAAAATQLSGLEKLRLFIRSMLDDSHRNGPLLYFGEHPYLAPKQRNEVDGWPDRLKAVLEEFINEGMADGSVVPCEPALVVQLLVGMMIWLGKWVPTVPGLTVDRLMAAFNLVAFKGLSATRK